MNPNIILVLLDGSRWDRLKTNKKFLELQKKGVLLNNVITAIPYTFGSINVIFTGLYGKENGVDAYYKMFRLKKEVEFLPEILKEHGYFTCCNLITEKVISSRGFDIYQSHDEYKDDLSKMHPDLIKKCFKESNGKPVFCFLQFSRIHTVTVSEILKKYDWDNKEYYEKKDKNLKTFDEVFGEACDYAKIIYDTLDEMGKLENTVLIFFSDHGTGVGERFGERNYGVFTFEETIRTIYLFIGPQINQNLSSDKLTSTIDIFPTLLELADTSTQSKILGKSLVPFLKGQKDLEDRDYVFSETGGLQGHYPSPEEPNVFCIRTTKYKLIYQKTPDKWSLYDLVNDPSETNDLVGKDMDIENELKKRLLDWIDR